MFVVELIQSGVWTGVGFGMMLLLYAITTSDLVVRYVQTCDATSMKRAPDSIVPHPDTSSSSPSENEDKQNEAQEGAPPDNEAQTSPSQEPCRDTHPVDVEAEARDDVALVVPPDAQASCLDSCLCCCGICFPNVHTGTCTCIVPQVQYVASTHVAKKKIMRSCTDLLLVQGSSLHTFTVAYTTWTAIGQILSTALLRDVHWLTMSENLIMHTSAVALFFLGYVPRYSSRSSKSCMSRYARVLLFFVYYAGSIGAIENANYRHGSEGFFGLSMMIVASTLLMSMYVLLRVSAIDDPVLGLCGCMYLPISGRLKWSRIFLGIQGLALLCPQVILALLVGTPGINILAGHVGRLLPG